MKQKLLLFASTLFSTMLFSQAQNRVFEDFKTNDGTQNFFYKNVVKTDASGNIYTLGATTTSNGTTDILLTKKNSSGVTLWTKQINGSANHHDFGAGLAVTTSGDVYITGAITNNTTTLAPELIIRKYNSSGTQQFSTTYSGAGYGCVGKDIAVDGSGNSYITGAAYNSGFTADILTIAFGSTGTQLWADLFDYTGLNDGGVKIGVKSNKVTVTGGTTYSANNYKIATITFTASTGVRSETVTLGSTMTSSVEIVTGMTTDASGNTYICGATEVSGQGYNMYVAKLTSSLTIAWQQTYNGSSNLDDIAKGIQVDASGNVYITGYSTSSTQGKDIRTIKYNSSGTLQWNNVINSTTNGNDQAYDMEIDASSNIYVVGSIARDNGNLLDYYTVKYNSSGTKIWDIQTDGNHLNDQATNVALDSLNNIIVTGESETATGVYSYLTLRYVQNDIQIPIEASPEDPNPQYIFYENKGQILNSNGTAVESTVTHATMDAYPAIFFKPKTFTYKLFNLDTLKTIADTTQRIDITLDGGRENAKGYSLDSAAGLVNFFDAKLPTNALEIQGYKRIVASEVYAGIDAHYYSNRDGLKIYYVVKPGVDPRNIVWDITGANTTTLSGVNLEIQGMNRKIVYDQPKFYQTNLAGTTTSTLAAGTWTAAGTNKYKFNTPTYNTSLPLIIELDYGNSVLSPALSIANLDMCTYYGGARDEGFRVIKSASSDGRYVVAGTTNSWAQNREFPTAGINSSSVTTVYTYMTLVMFDINGIRLCANIYGGYADIEPTDIVIDNINTRKVTVIGNTTATTMISANSYSTAGTYSSSVGPGFAIQFDQWIPTNGSPPQSLTAIAWTTRLNGYASNIGITPNSQSLYITTSTNSTYKTPDLMPKTNAYNNSTNSGDWDFQISKFNRLGVRQWATYFPTGGTYAVNTYSPTYAFNNYSQGTKEDPWLKCRIDCDNNGFVIAGEVKSTSLPYYNKYHKAMDSTYNGGTDAFVARFNSKDSLVFSQYIGGTKEDGYLGVKITGPNEISLVGYSQSPEYQDLTYRRFGYEYKDSLMTSSATKILVTKLDSTGSKLWSTYFGNGSSAPCIGWAMTNDSKGNIIITGTTYGSFNIATSNATGLMNKTTQLDLTSGTAGTGLGDGFMLAFNSSNILSWNTYFGGKFDDAGLSLHYSPKHDRVLITGITGTPTWEPCCVYHELFPACHPNTIHPSAWWKGSINASAGVGSLSFSNYDGYIGWWNTDLIVIGIHEYFKDNSNQDLFSLYPNPTTNESYIAFKNRIEGKVSIEIYSVTGQLLYIDTKNGIMDHSIITLPTNNFSNGVYVVNVKNNANFISKKLVISK